MPGYGFAPTEGGEPIKTGAGPPSPSPVQAELRNPVLGREDAVAAGERIYRGRCAGCHRSGCGAAGPSLFRTGLSPAQFLDTVTKGRPGTAMAPFAEILSRNDIWQVHAFLLSRDSL